MCEARGVWLHIDGAYGLRRRPPSRARRGSRASRGRFVLGRRSQVAVPSQPAASSCEGDDALAARFARTGYLPHQQHELLPSTSRWSNRAVPALKMWLAFRAHGAAQSATRSNATWPSGPVVPPRADDEDFEVMEAPPQLSIVPIRHVPPGVADPRRAQPGARRRDQADGRA